MLLYEHVVKGVNQEPTAQALRWNSLLAGLGLQSYLAPPMPVMLPVSTLS